MEWISVKDRLPEPGFYLVYCPEYTNYEMPMIAQFIEGKGFWDFDSWNDNSCNQETTHWMPLPEPPEI